MIQFKVIKTNLQPSSAGIGSKLNTQRFMLIIAHIMSIKISHAHILLLIKSTIQIGQLICCKASSLSVGVSGRKIFCPNIQIALNVNII
jgi:hypothetical protein